jgi:uncharacterized protein (TIGR03118 family)
MELIMKNIVCKKMATGRMGFSLAAALMTMASVSRAEDVQFQQIDLVSDLPGVATLQDTNLVNSWGIAFSPASPFWVSDNGSGLATLYAITNDSTGVAHVAKQSLQVTIPGDGTPSGMVNNTLGGFNGDAFLFVSEDGTIAGWRSALGTAAETLVPGNTNNVYKGVTLASTASGPVLLASNFRQATVDMYGTNGTNVVLLGQFSDSRAPRGYAPFGMQSLDGLIFVTFAKQDDARHDDVAGRGNGLIDIFNPQTGRFHRFATGSEAGGSVDQMDSPWGVALAPSGFGGHSGELLVGNFGSGSIMTFDSFGNFRGQLQGLNGERLVIDGLWGLTVGNGTKAGVTNTLYFSAGPFGESHGIFGSLTPVQVPGNGHGHGHDHNDGDRD